jgi:sugar phosphate isomerase/epimerase
LFATTIEIEKGVKLMIYGLSTHLFAKNKLSANDLGLIADNGINVIEIFANSHQIDFDNHSQLQEIQNAVVKYNLMVNSVHAPFYFSLSRLKEKKEVLDISSNDNSFREKSVNEILKSFILASLFEVDYYVLHFPINPNEDNLLKSLDILVKMSSDLGFKLAFENIPGVNTNTGYIAKFIETHMLPVGICFDTGHSNMENSVYNDIENYGHLFYSTHIHDNNKTDDSHSLPFTGTINWTKTLKLFHNQYYKWGFILEVRQINNNLKQTFSEISKVMEKFKSLEKV